MRINSLAWSCLMVSAMTTATHVWADDGALHGMGNQALQELALQPFPQQAPAETQVGDKVGKTAGETVATSSPEPLNITMSNDEQQLFYQCAKILDNAGRLACFDALSAHDTPSVIAPKQSLDLSGTLKSTIAGSPQVVLKESVDETPAVQDLPKAVHDDKAGKHNKSDKAVLTELGLSKEELSRYTPLSLSFDLDKNSERGLWSARPHDANYFLPFYLHTRPNRSPMTPTLGAYTFTEDEMRDVELKFQLSLKTKAMENVFGTNADLWIGYTQQSHWQVYNENHSRPFRAHDYQPEIFLTQPVSAELPFGGRLRVLGAGGVHHSNGETDPLSRSWNRLYVMGGAEWGKLTIMPRLWTRLNRKEGSKPEDNPDITDYYGHGDVRFLYQLDKGKNLSGMVRFNPSTKKGAVELNYAYPLHRGISGYLQIFHGYGQSLVDYNHEATSVGLGIVLNDWMGL